jgi:hypothetical protein
MITEAGMDDRSNERGGRGGPPETQWLDLEITKVIQGRAEALVRAAAEEILKDAMKARLLERLGPRLQAVGRLVADELADDIEANLDIEARIAARREARRSLDGRIAEALANKPEEPKEA